MSHTTSAALDDHAVLPRTTRDAAVHLTPATIARAPHRRRGFRGSPRRRPADDVELLRRVYELPGMGVIA